MTKLNEEETVSVPHTNGIMSNGHYNTTKNGTLEHVPKQCVLLSFHWWKMCAYGIMLPLTALVICLVSAYLYHDYDDIMENSCKVPNFIPSISSIIGIYPQCYVWRLFIAFHLGPRLLLAPTYYRYYQSHIANVPMGKRNRYNTANSIAYWLSTTETFTFTAVSYISNRDNYPAHEKLFVTYLLSSAFYMMLTIFVLYPLAKPKAVRSSSEDLSLKLKKFYFYSVIFCMALVLYFYRQHMLYCSPLSFSWFALAEYMIAVANMSFHFTVYYDFPDHLVVLGKLPDFQATSRSYNTNTISSSDVQESGPQINKED